MKYFKDSPKGVVVSMDTESTAELSYAVWFPYTKMFVGEIKVGSFVAVRNYSGVNGDNTFSILELVSVFPKHYALGVSSRDTERAFPGFVIEAAKNAKVDWEQEEPIEQTTKIKAEAISTGLQLTITQDNKASIDVDESLPMIGEDAHLLTDEQINQIVNKGLLSEKVPTIEPCTLILNDKVGVKLSTEDLLRTHFGVFGFTGAGKSNLLSNLISNLISVAKENKVVLFDLMTEYSGLLIDLIHKIDEAYILCVTEDSLPGSQAVEDYIRGDESKLNEAAESIVRTLLLPKELIPYQDKYLPLFKEILKANKIRIFSTGSTNPTISDLRSELSERIQSGSRNNEFHIRRMIDEHLRGSGVDPVSEQQLQALDADIGQALQDNALVDYTRQEGGESVQQSLMGTAPRAPTERTVRLNDTGRIILSGMQEVVRGYLSATKEEPLPEKAILSMDQIYRTFTDKSKPALIIVQSNRDDDLRDFSSHMVNYAFRRRRTSGEIDPHVLFLYDEADEFIPQSGGESYQRSRSASTLLARRGRKFGLGLALATQRVAYLDTSILAQPHTFLLSKLPREYDRDTIGKAFGASKEMIQRTLTFTKGQWMLFSYDATGLTNIPLPVKFPNANERIKEYLDKYGDQ